MSAIYVDAPDKSSGKRVQHIHIKYDGLGVIRLNELMKKETAWPKSRRPLKTQGFHHFSILLFYDHPAGLAAYFFFSDLLPVIREWKQMLDKHKWKKSI